MLLTRDHNYENVFLSTLDSPGVKKNTFLKWLEMKNGPMWVQGCVVKGHSFKGGKKFILGVDK